MDQNELTTQEWYTVLEGASAATGVIAASDLSGPLGLVKEAAAGVEALRQGDWKTPFISAFRTEVLAASKERQEEFKKIAQARQAELMEQKPSKEQSFQMGLAAISNAVALVESKAGAEAAAEYRQLVYQTAVKAAEAGKEGGFLGFGGTLVSEKEQDALNQIKQLLGL